VVTTRTCSSHLEGREPAESSALSGGRQPCQSSAQPQRAVLVMHRAAALVLLLASEATAQDGENRIDNIEEVDVRARHQPCTCTDAPACCPDGY
jgi:hypothetical protein